MLENGAVGYVGRIDLSNIVWTQRGQCIYIKLLPGLTSFPKQILSNFIARMALPFIRLVSGRVCTNINNVQIYLYQTKITYCTTEKEIIWINLLNYWNTVVSRFFCKLV